MNKNDIIIQYIDEIILNLRKLGFNIPYVEIRLLKNEYLDREESIEDLKEELDNYYEEYIKTHRAKSSDPLEELNNNKKIDNKYDSYIGETYKTSIIGLFDIYEKVINDPSIEDKEKKFLELRDEYLTNEVKRLDSFAEAQSSDEYKVKSVKMDMFKGFETLKYKIVANLYNTFINDINLVVPQNEGKMNYIIDNTKKVFNSDGSINNDIYNFNDLGKVLEYGKRHGKELKLHTLIWHKSIPENLQSEIEALPSDQQRGALLTFINNYFYNISKYLKDNNYKLRQIDVLNEIVSDDDNKELLRNSFFKRILGNNPENGDNYYIDILRMARSYFPDVEFIYNEYNEFNPKKADRICSVIKDIKDKSIRDGINYIDGLGLQTHIAPYTSASKATRMEVTPLLIYETMNKYNSLGIPLYRTEIDSMEFEDKSRVNSLFESVRQSDKVSNVFGICLYGNSEALGWRNSSSDGHFIKKDGTPKEIFSFYKVLMNNRKATKKLDEATYINSLLDKGLSNLESDISLDKLVEEQARVFSNEEDKASQDEKLAIGKGKEYFSNAVSLGFSTKDDVLESSKAITTMNLSSDQTEVDSAKEKLEELKNKNVKVEELPKVKKKSSRGSTTALFIGLNIGIIGSCIGAIIYIITNFS